MRKINDCKIVQNLLPNYIDGITDNELNAYIEEHLNNCEKCSRVKQNMDDNITMENANTIKEVKYLKKIKKKAIFTIAICLILLFALLCGLDYYFNYEHIANWKYTNIIVQSEEFDYQTNTAYNITYIFTFNKKGICVDTRLLLSNLNKDMIDVFSEAITETATEIANVQILDNKITVNIDMYNGMKKEEIINWANSFSYDIIEI